MSKKSKSGVIVFIIIVIVVVGLAVLSLLSNKNETAAESITGNPNGVSTQFESYKLVDKKSFVAAIYIEGTIEDANASYNQKWILSTINNLKYDSNNIAIALYINSPGGGVYQADEVYLSLLDYKTTGKKVYVYMGPLAASGGYYISCAADKIYANRNTLTGSIGVISSQVFDLTELMENLGIESTTIYSGDNKNMGSFTEPFTYEQQEIMQTICDEYYEQFLSIVIKERNLPEKWCRELADGRVYTASQAVNNGLIDSISTWDEMITDLCYAAKNIPLCKVKTYKYEKKKTFMEEMLYTITSIQTSKASVNNRLPMYLYTK